MVSTVGQMFFRTELVFSDWPRHVLQLYSFGKIHEDEAVELN